MEHLLSQLRSLSELYGQLEIEIARWEWRGGLESESLLIDSILRSRELVARLDRMTPEIVRLAGDWRNSEAPAHSGECEEIVKLAAEAVSRASKLNDAVCGLRCELHAIWTRLKGLCDPGIMAGSGGAALNPTL